MSNAWSNPEANEADFEIDIEGVSPDDINTSGRVNRPGLYHVEVEDVKPELDTVSKSGGAKTPSVRFDLRVLCSAPNQSPEGSMLFHRVYMPVPGEQAKEGSRNLAIKFALGLGLIAKSEGGFICTETKQQMKGLPIALWRRAKGMQFIAKVEAEEYNGRTDYRIPFNEVYAVDDPSVADVPKSREHLELIGKQAAAAPAKPTQAKPPKSPSRPAPTRPAAEAAVVDGYDLSNL